MPVILCQRQRNCVDKLQALASEWVYKKGSYLEAKPDIWITVIPQIEPLWVDTIVREADDVRYSRPRKKSATEDSDTSSSEFGEPRGRLK